MIEKIKMFLRLIVFFAVAAFLLWLLGIGRLFENTDRLRALFTFSAVIAIVLEVMNQVTTSIQSKIKELEKRIEELEKLKD